MTVRPALLEAALVHAARGRPVFPCDPAKKPRTRRGFLDASTDPEMVRRWWLRDPCSLIGMPTGARSGIVVVDLDVKEGRKGIEAFADLQADREVSQTLVVQTASGGRHLYFAHPVGRTVRCSQSRIAPGVDVRGDGGYAVIPPSPGYSVVERGSMAPLPDWLLEILAPPLPRPDPPRFISTALTPIAQQAAAERRFEAVLRVVMSAPAGSRHNRLFWGACRCGEMAASGALDEGTAASALVAAALAAGGKDIRNARNTVSDGLRRGREEALRA